MIKHLLERELHLDIKRVQGRQKAKGIYTEIFFLFLKMWLTIYFDSGNLFYRGRRLQ